MLLIVVIFLIFAFIHFPECLLMVLAHIQLLCLTGDLDSKTFERALCRPVEVENQLHFFPLVFLLAFRTRGNATEFSTDSNVFLFFPF